MTSAVVVETYCEHGEVDGHAEREPGWHGSSPGLWCNGGSRRVLNRGEFVLVEKTPGGRWPMWAIKAAASEITSSRKYRTDARKALDALAQEVTA